MKKDKLYIIRIGKITPHTSMDNYFRNCLMPLAEKLLENGHEVKFHTNMNFEQIKTIPFRFENRQGLKHILGMAIDEIQIAFHRVLSRKKVNIINMNQLLPNILCAKSTIMIIHDIMPLEYPDFWPLLHKYYKYYLGPVLKKCKKIISVSNTTSNKINQFYNVPLNKMHTIYNGIKFNDEEFNINKSSEENSYIYVGANLPNKNLELLVRTFSKMDDSISLHMVGGCCNNEQVIKAAQQYKNIKLLGFVTDEELKREYINCRALIYPSVSEGFGLPLVEAMWYGKSIIAADKDYAREVCADYPAIFFDVENEKELIDIINKFPVNKTYEVKYNKNELVEKYSWENAVANFMELIENID